MTRTTNARLAGLTFLFYIVFGIIPVLAIPVLLVLLLMIYWLAHVLLMPGYSRRAAPGNEQ